RSWDRLSTPRGRIGRAVAGLLADGSNGHATPSQTRAAVQWPLAGARVLPDHSGEGRAGLTPASRTPRRRAPYTVLCFAPPGTYESSASQMWRNGAVSLLDERSSHGSGDAQWRDC